jgi:DNA invertase Pin-like site-specific DNA recombinase
MKRPGLQRLLADVADGGVDIIVVYKIDRLTRSLGDFAKIVEILDSNGASFVSVTQQFNTTSSMGRLTLNVLLSFAQFEREVAGERVRDKIAASKRRGMWMGGHPPLGYDRVDKKLVVNEQEAEIVRFMFQRYLELGTVAALQKDQALRARLSTVRVRSGKRLGRERYGRSALYNLLRNQAYIGQVPHRDKWFLGNHSAIVDRSLWESVQRRLDAHKTGSRVPHVRDAQSPLVGLLFDAGGNPMTPSFAKKGSRLRYRYYVSQALLQNRVGERSGILRVPATVIEQVVAETLQTHLKVTGGEINWYGNVRQASLRQVLEKVVVTREGLRIQLRDQTNLVIPGVFVRTGRGLAFQRYSATALGRSRRAALPLIRAICRANRWRQLLEAGAVRSYLELARRERMNPGYVRRLTQLAFLAPDLIEGIIGGRLTAREGLVKLTASDLPLSWRMQRELFVAAV